MNILIPTAASICCGPALYETERGKDCADRKQVPAGEVDGRTCAAKITVQTVYEKREGGIA